MRADSKVQEDIKSIVSMLLNKFHNRDPFHIARSLGIEISFLDFNEDILAFSERRDSFDRGRIYINNNMGAYVKKVLCAHELGHMLLHDICETTFFDSDIEPLKEYEANYFTAILMPQIVTNKNVLDFSVETFNEYVTHRILYASKLERTVKLE
jgi:Zn-dependent peptidase ImmA (M78 family)